MSTVPATPPQPAPITDAERARRRSALDGAIGNLRGEGMYVSPQDKPLHEAYVNGVMTSAEVIAELDRRYKKK